MTDHYDDTTLIPGLEELVFDIPFDGPTSKPVSTFYTAPDIELSDYSRIIVCMSGGKDSLACLLHLLEVGVDKNIIELWHHDVDGREGSHLMDWIFMAEYNQRIADEFDVPLYFSWLKDGFEGELLKEDSISQPHIFESPTGVIALERDASRSKPGTRRRFPQVAASLRTRWCSSVLKIDVARRALNNQERFNHKRTLFITGERREESSNRARYNQLEPHFCDRRDGRLARHVDAWRPVLHWSEEDVWACLERHRVIAPVPYRLGWGRSSCMGCIFNDDRIWATIGKYFPERLESVSRYEGEFGVTISRSKRSVKQRAQGAAPLPITDLEALQQAMSHQYTLPVVLEPRDEWRLPAGAFTKHGCGAN
ncbi:TPA: phosphoadenosine phosphosulfate reductase family protein [Klebsiella aerogenes]